MVILLYPLKHDIPEVFGKRILACDLQGSFVEIPVLIKVVGDTGKMDPSGKRRTVNDNVVHFCVKDPIDHIILIPEMVVKAFAVDTAAFT
jgi:hypothetical protein